MGKSGHSHRATLKKDHKPFKSRHASKGQIKSLNKGKVDKSAGSGKGTRELSKIERKNMHKQLKANKILETKRIRKLFEGSSGAEKIITVISLTDDIPSEAILSQLINSVKESLEQADIDFTAPSVHTVKLPRFKSNAKFILPNPTDLIDILDACKVSDYVVFGLSAQKEIDPTYGEQILRAVIAQGVASVIGVLPNLVSAYPKKNLQQDIRQSLQSFFTHFFPAEEKLFALENETECANCLRVISQKFPALISWRDSRAYMVADSAQWLQTSPESGYVVVEGTVRGVGFDPNRLVHLPGHGDFQLERIESVARHAKDTVGGQVYTPDESQETLEELNPQELDMDDNEDGLDLGDDDEQWGVQMEGKNYFNSHDDLARRKHRLPRGTSEYQGKWLLDDVLEGASDAEEVDGESDIDIEENEMDNEQQEEADVDGDVDGAGDAMEDTQSEMFVELSPEEEEQQLREYRAMEKEDREFPDEIELDPRDSAKKELGQYRGVKSLGNCNWDWDEQDEERPSIYSRLLHINNFKATRNKLHKDAVKQAQVQAGSKARLYIRAPQFVLNGVDATARVFSVYLMLEHEHKLAMTNFSFKTWEDYEKPVPTGEPLTVQYGFRRYVITPTFNQASNSSNNVHKCERFAHHGDTCIASAIAPVMFENAPAIFFKTAANAEGPALELVGQGTFLNCDHTRVIAQRVVLTGHPVKIHRKLVTVRYMFFNVEDINWFKAVPLFTKSGRTGFIKESLGTHGYFKCTFDGSLLAQDVVAMALYKRVWPRV